jgi:putative ABC transport system permease protein
MMIAPRWRKVFRDIGETPLRTTLAVVAMAAGVFGLGTILTAYTILKRELATTYSDTHPAAAILSVDRADEATIAITRRVRGVAEVEARPMVNGRIRVGADQWAPLVIFVVPDFNDIRLDKFSRDTGSWPPRAGEILIERSCMTVANASVGGNVTVRTTKGSERSLRIAGTVHAAGLAPGWMDHVVTGFVTAGSSLRDTGSESAQLRISLQRNPLDESAIRETADEVRGALEKQGREVTRIDIPKPGRHPHADQMDTFLFLLGAFGALTFVLGSVLVANLIHALLSEQVRQVAIMKTIGASNRQLITLYLGQVAILAIASLAFGVPLALAAGRAYARFCSGILNATIVNAWPGLSVLLLEVIAGIALPLLVALVPVIGASRISIREAFSNGAGRRPFGVRRFDRWLARIALLPRPVMLALRTAFHRRGRLLLTIGTLAAGGAAFLAAMNVSAAWDRTLDAEARAHHYDLSLRLDHSYDSTRVGSVLSSLPQLEHTEYWAETAGTLTGAGGRAERVGLVGPPPGSTLLVLPLVAGRRLTSEDRGVAVVNQSVIARDPSLHVGGRVQLLVSGRPVSWQIAGVVSELMPVPIVYAPVAEVRVAAAMAAGTVRSARIVTRDHTVKGQLAAARAVERGLSSNDIGVSGVTALSDVRKAFADHLVIIKSALIFSALLVVFVGALGLASTLTLNVIERTREIGVLGAIGATPRMIGRTVLVEGLVMASLSWLLAVLIAIPLTMVLDAVNGKMFVRSPLEFYMSPLALLSWLALVLILAALSSFFPARRSARFAIREALAYE